jgi:hypothetical protein
MPQTIGPGQRQATIVVSATPTAASSIGELKSQSTALINGKPAVREARPASVAWLSPWSVFDHKSPSRLDRHLMFAVHEPAPFSLGLTIDQAELKPGDKATVTVKVNRPGPTSRPTSRLSPSTCRCLTIDRTGRSRHHPPGNHADSRQG